MEVGTAVMTHGLTVYKEIADGIADYMENNGFTSIDEMVGLAHDYENTGIDTACTGMTK